MLNAPTFFGRNVILSKSHVAPPFLLNNTKLVLIFIRTVISCQFLELFVTNWLLYNRQNQMLIFLLIVELKQL